MSQNRDKCHRTGTSVTEPGQVSQNRDKCHRTETSVTEPPDRLTSFSGCPTQYFPPSSRCRHCHPVIRSLPCDSRTKRSTYRSSSRWLLDSTCLAHKSRTSLSTRNVVTLTARRTMSCNIAHKAINLPLCQGCLVTEKLFLSTFLLKFCTTGVNNVYLKQYQNVDGKSLAPT